jgi:hypothetical protein
MLTGATAGFVWTHLDTRMTVQTNMHARIDAGTRMHALAPLVDHRRPSPVHLPVPVHPLQHFILLRAPRSLTELGTGTNEVCVSVSVSARCECVLCLCMWGGEGGSVYAHEWVYV